VRDDVMEVIALMEQREFENDIVRGVYTSLDKATKAAEMSGRDVAYFYYVLLTVDKEDIEC
jgi:hypothetical protein